MDTFGAHSLMAKKHEQLRKTIDKTAVVTQETEETGTVKPAAPTETEQPVIKHSSLPQAQDNKKWAYQSFLRQHEQLSAEIFYSLHRQPKV